MPCAYRLIDIVADHISRVRHVPRGVSCVRRKSVSAIGPVVALEDQPRHFAAEAVVEDITHGALGKSLLLGIRAGRSRLRTVGGLAGSVEDRRPGQRGHAGAWLRFQRDMGNGVSQCDAIEKSMR